MIGSAAFFDPLIVTVPFSFLPPLMTSLSRLTSPYFIFDIVIQKQLFGITEIWYISAMREFLIYQDDDGAWVAEAKELPGVHMRGATQKEALEKIQAALKIYYPCRCED